MTAKSLEWEPTRQAFKEVPDPTYNDDDDAPSLVEQIMNAGYNPEISTNLEYESVGANVTIYATEKDGLPRFYIDVWGQSSQIATFVAQDFVSLLETLKQLHPLLALIGTDQAAQAFACDRLQAENKARKRA